jgi:tetratricopeptide (TPR) repeat protein
LAKEVRVVSEIPVLDPHRRRYVVHGLMVVVLLYAVLAGLRTVADPDTGWQLASGRYIVEHHQIPSTDVFSYTARGHEWIYPPISELFLYALYFLGGFAALSWLTAAACAGTVGIAFSAEGGLAAAVLAVLAIPKIAYRTAARADLFTTVLFAALLAVLWRHFRGRYAPLWLLPLILLVWVNTHPGFMAGLALLIGYVGLELSEFLFAERRAAARARLRRAAPWLLAAPPATLCNRWGWGIYSAVFQQERALSVHENVIAEWRRVPLTAATLSQALDWRNYNSSYFWLLATVAVASVVALKRKELGPAALLLGSAYLSLEHIRFQALFAIVAIVVGAPFFAGWFMRPAVEKTQAKRRRPESAQNQLAPALTILLVGASVLLVGIRGYDLISQRAYLSAGQPSLFGAGLSSWYPERAADFVLHQRLPGNIFHDYNMGGYLLFRLGPQYPDYIDGRAIPFGEVMFEQRKVLEQPPDSPAWQQEADQRGINTLIFSIARYWGGGQLPRFCASEAWKPVYLDEVGAVFVRNRPENAEIIHRLQIDCAKVRFEPPAALLADTSFRGRADLFNFYAHAGSALYKLSRKSEAEAALDRALGIFPDEPYLHHTRAQLYEANRQMGDAEREYQTSARLGPTEANWYSLGMLYFSEHRYTEAARAMQQAAESSVRPSEYYSILGNLYLAMKQPQEALKAFDAADAKSHYEPPDARFKIETQVTEGRAVAWANMGDLDRAVEFEREALKLTPSNPQLWATLAQLYAAQGRTDLAQEARQHAQDLSRPKP